MPILATHADANKHLDQTKISFPSAGDALPEATEASRIVRGKLADMFPDHVDGWDEVVSDPAQAGYVPELVREATSLLMASYRYAKKYSEESLGPNPYADALEARAMTILNGILDGTFTLSDVEYGIGQGDLDREDFWPNSTTTEFNEEMQREFESAHPGFASTRRFSTGDRF